MVSKYTDAKNGVVYLQGDLDVYSVGDALKDGQRLIMANKSINTIDFSRTGKIDSAGLAFVIEILKFAKKRKLKLHFKNIPARMHAVAEIYGLSKILPDSVFQSS